eukprot:scaffold19099_cov69-Cylindrotheca_fusiformis.AAC.1
MQCRSVIQQPVFWIADMLLKNCDGLVSHDDDDEFVLLVGWCLLLVCGVLLICTTSCGLIEGGLVLFSDNYLRSAVISEHFFRQQIITPTGTVSSMADWSCSATIT